jgi:hypothetical protein
MNRDFEYENSNTGYDGGIKCKNYEICDCVLPKWWFEYKGHYLCTECHMMFGTWGKGENKHLGNGVLVIKDNIECPICTEYKRGVSQPRCSHFVCIDCFKRCYYGDESREGEPAFPYPEVED